MYRTIAAGIVAILFGSMLQAQNQFSMRAASSDPVQGWTKMELGDRVVYVSPVASLTAADVERAEPTTTPDGKRAMMIYFTDAGAEKSRRLSSAQFEKLIAMVLDDKLIWAPLVRAEIGKEALLTGNGPNGLSEAVIQRILASVKK